MRINFSDGYLMNRDEPDVPPVCAKCNNAILSAKHMLLACPSVSDKRRVLGTELSLEGLLNAETAENLIQFLKDVNIFNYI